MKKKKLEKRVKQLLEENEWLRGDIDLLNDEVELLEGEWPEEKPYVHAVIFDGPLTAVAWSDYSVTRTHCQEGDEYDPLLGLLICIFRKISKNKGHMVEAYEPLLRMMADFIKTEEDIDHLVQILSLAYVTADHLDCSRGAWLPQLARGDE